MTRKAIFDAIKAARQGASFTQAEVSRIDTLLDSLSVPVDGSSDIPADYWPMLAKIESGARPYIKAPTSSASGLYQFIRNTWLGEGGQWGGDVTQAFGGLKPTEQEQTQRARTFTEKNVKVLKAAGLRINKATLYAAHFLGAGMAVKLLGSPVTARADHIAGEAATNANPSILRGKLVGDFINWLEKKTGDRA